MTTDYTTGELLPVVPIGPLAASLAKAQAAFPAVARSKTVTVNTKTGGSYKFSYAPLEAILDAVRKPLADNGLALAQLLDNGALVTILMHESGGSLEGRTQIPATADVQGLGSAITYLRRYAIQALLGIAAEEDDDGNSAAGKKTTHADERAKTPPIPESASTFRPLVGAEVPGDDHPEPPRPLPKAGMVQCASISPLTKDQCRREQGHPGNRHRTENESWTDA